MIGKKGVIFGSTGLAGSGISGSFNRHNFNYYHPKRSELDLLDENAVNQYFDNSDFDYVVIAAGVVGGIHQNIDKQSHFLISNFEICKNILQAAARNKIENLIMITSSCIYPVQAEMPLKEVDFYHGAPEVTNSGHAIGKKAACWLLEHYRLFHGLNWTALISSSLYGLEDDFSGNGHVIPGLINRFMEAFNNNHDIEPIWGKPETAREFLFNSDLGEAVVHLLPIDSRPSLINVGSGETVSLLELAQIIQGITGYAGEIRFDESKPSGWPIREVDSSYLLNLGWVPRILLKQGLKDVVLARL